MKNEYPQIRGKMSKTREYGYSRENSVNWLRRYPKIVLKRANHCNWMTKLRINKSQYQSIWTKYLNTGAGGCPPNKKRRSKWKRGLGDLSPKHKRSVYPEKPSNCSINQNKIFKYEIIELNRTIFHYWYYFSEYNDKLYKADIPWFIIEIEYQARMGQKKDNLGVIW